MKIFILGTSEKAETIFKLAKHLKECEAGFVLPENYQEYFIISYGKYSPYSNLNKNLCFNKFLALKKLAMANIPIPKIIYTPNPKLIPKHEFPLIVRKFHHYGGKDAIFLKTKKSMLKRLKRVKKRDYFIKYVPKKAEFRVHVLGEEIGNISQKEPYDPEAVTPHPHIWSYSRGWTIRDYDGEYNEILSEIAIKSVKALGYDFGAVDIILGQDNKFYVLEVNSAPRLCRKRRRIYAKFFRKKEREYSQR